MNPNQFLIATGVSFGAYQAVTFGLKHPEQVGRILGMSGRYDIRRLSEGYSDPNVYFNNPVHFIANEHDEARLTELRRVDIILVAGTADRLTRYARELSRLLWEKGIWHAFQLWDGWHHDWEYWHPMVRTYIGGAN